MTLTVIHLVYLGAVIIIISISWKRVLRMLARYLVEHSMYCCSVSVKHILCTGFNTVVTGIVRGISRNARSNENYFFTKCMD